MSLTPVEDDADVFVAPAAMVVPLTAPPLPSSSASSAIKAGSPFCFGYSAMSATDDDLWTSLKKQDAAAKDMLYKMTGDEDVWVRTVSDRVGNQLKDKLNYKRPIWVTALSPHVCFLGYKCGGVFQVEDKEMDHITKLKVWPRNARTAFSKEKPWLWEVIDPENQPEKAGRVAKTKWVHVLVAHMVFVPSLMMHAYAIGSGCPPSRTTTMWTRKHMSSEWPSDTAVTGDTAVTTLILRVHISLTSLLPDAFAPVISARAPFLGNCPPLCTLQSVCALSSHVFR